MDRAGFPFVALAALPAAFAALLGAMAVALALLVLPIAIGLFFRDPRRTPPAVDRDTVLSPADGTVMFAGDAKPEEAPSGAWRQVTIFLSPLDVHINRAPVGGLVTRVDYHHGSFLPAYKSGAHANERSEIWFDVNGRVVVARQVVGVMARRIVCRLVAGDRVALGDRIGLMKFGSRMDVFMPSNTTLSVSAGQRVRGGETIIARLEPAKE
jgi:phosphatidylserine decarboxylase